MRWTTDDIEFLTIATEAGWLAKDIANELGRTTDAVISKRNRLGLVGPSGRPSEYTKEELIRLLQEAPNKTYNYLNSKESGLPAATTYRKYFGSWENALITAGLPLNISSMDSAKPTTVYLLYFSSGDYYKVGITQQRLAERFSGRYPAYEVVLELSMELKDARELEKCWKESVREFMYIPDDFPKDYSSGVTECFKISDAACAKLY